MSKKLIAIKGKLTDELFVLSMLLELMGRENSDTSRLLEQIAETTNRCHKLMMPPRVRLKLVLS